MEDLKDDAIHVIKFVRENDLGWVEDCAVERQQLLLRIQKRLEGKSVLSNEEKERIEKELVEVIKQKMNQIGNTDVDVKNVRLYFEDKTKYALANIAYTWWLNAWDKRVKHIDAVFVLVDDEWKSPLFR
jgi:hypothetical protein